MPQPATNNANARTEELSARDINVVPTADINRNIAIVLLGPNLSKRTPTGSCIKAEPKNKAAGKELSSIAVKFNSLLKSGAMTAGTDLKNWLSIKAKPKKGTITIIRSNFDRCIKQIIFFNASIIGYMKGIYKGRALFWP